MHFNRILCKKKNKKRKTAQSSSYSGNKCTFSNKILQPDCRFQEKQDKVKKEKK